MSHYKQEVVLKKGIEAFVVALSFAKRPSDFAEKAAGRLRWESSVQIELPSSFPCLELMLEAVVAVKIRDGFQVVDHVALLLESKLVEEDIVWTRENCPCTDTHLNDRLASLPDKAGETCETYTFCAGEEELRLDLDASQQVPKEKKGGTSILQLAQYFHQPINEAAKILDICPTVLKKICRKHGLRRWPHRKLKSINKSIEKLEGLVSSLQHDPGRENQLVQIFGKLSELRKEKAVLCFDTECV